MNILQIIPELNVGGVETGTVDFAQYLKAHGHTAVVVSNGGELVEELEKAGIRHFALPVHQKSLWTIWRMVGELRAIILEEKIDIVHARSRVPAWIAYFACRRTKAAFITTCHGYYHNHLFSQVMGWSRLVIVPSKVIGRHMVENYKVLPTSIRCIARSVDVAKFANESNDRQGRSTCTITMIGRITQLKGHTFFLKSMAQVIRTLPHAKIWVVGDAPAAKAPYKQQLIALVRHLGINNHVEFLGNRRDIPEILSKTDVVVLSTVTQEAFGRVILEAQAAGVPVVATTVGGVVDIIDHEETGLLVLPKDTQAMAQAVIRLIQDKALAHRMVVKAKEKISRHFTLEHMASKTIEVYNELLGSINILVIKIGSVGDVVLVTASLKAIRQKFPHAKIHCLVGKESRKILQNCPYIDGVIVFDRNGKERGWLNLFKFSVKLLKYRFDVVIDFQNSRKSHLLAYLSYSRESYGYNNGKWGRLLSCPVEDGRKDLAAVEHQFKVLEKLGIVCPDHVSLELWPSTKDEQYVQTLFDSQWLGNSSNIVGINIAASAKWQTKAWPLEHIAKFCDILAAKGIRVVMTGMGQDEPLAQYVMSIAKSKPANFVGKTDILQLAALIRRCKVFVTPDSAPLHIAAAMRVPVVALFGPTDFRRHSPPVKKMVVLQKQLACAPCYASRCRILTHACMKDIGPEEAVEAVESLMGAGV